MVNPLIQSSLIDLSNLVLLLNFENFSQLSASRVYSEILQFGALFVDIHLNLLVTYCTDLDIILLICHLNLCRV